MEEQRLAACAEKLKRLNEKHRQAAESKPGAAQASDDNAAALEDAPSTPALASSPTPPPAPLSQSPATSVEVPPPERAEQEPERAERVEQSPEEEVHLARQPSPPLQRPAATLAPPEPQGLSDGSLAEVGPLVEENQTDGTTVPMRDYFNMEDNRGKL